MPAAGWTPEMQFCSVLHAAGDPGQLNDVNASSQDITPGINSRFERLVEDLSEAFKGPSEALLEAFKRFLRGLSKVF